MNATSEETVLDQRLVKAMAHPLRYQILIELNQRIASPKELADEFGEELGVVSYHVRTLRKLGCIELVRTTPRRGAVEHHYRAVMRPFFSAEQWARLPASARRSADTVLASRVVDDIASATGAGGFDRDDTHLSRTPLALDEQGWKDVQRILADALEAILDTQAQTNGRLAEAGGQTPELSAEVVLMHFERATQPLRPPKPRTPRRSSPPTK